MQSWTRKLMRCSSGCEHSWDFRNDWIKVPACSSTIHESSVGIKLALTIQTFTGPGKHPVPLALMSAILVCLTINHYSQNNKFIIKIENKNEGFRAYGITLHIISYEHVFVCSAYVENWNHIKLIYPKPMWFPVLNFAIMCMFSVFLCTKIVGASFIFHFPFFILNEFSILKMWIP